MYKVPTDPGRLLGSNEYGAGMMPATEGTRPKEKHGETRTTEEHGQTRMDDRIPDPGHRIPKQHGPRKNTDKHGWMIGSRIPETGSRKDTDLAACSGESGRVESLATKELDP